MPVYESKNPFQGSFLESAFSNDPTGMASPLGMASAGTKAAAQAFGNEMRTPEGQALRKIVDQYLEGVDDAGAIHFLRGLRMGIKNAADLFVPVSKQVPPVPRPFSELFKDIPFGSGRVLD